MAENKTTDLTGLASQLAGQTVQGLRNAGRFLISNAALGRWFSPGQPLIPQAQDEANGRRYDFPVGQNLKITPKLDEGINFGRLRGLADSLDIVRLLIETRKDQICALEWHIRPKDGGDPDSRCKTIEQFLEFPDQEHDYQTWMRGILEDLLVIDAATVYPRRTQGGKLYSLVQLDGALIVPKIDYYGLRPVPPEPAYQHILKGVPAVDYSTDELIYKPRNFRAHKLYGFSPVEQIVMTIETALRRQIWQLQSYTEGNIPEAIIGVPDNWTPDQIRQFQLYWDSILSGNTAERRHAKFIPGGMTYIPTKPPELFGAAEEWLARVCCYAFSMSPQPFTQANNRATAETAKQTADEEGIAPTAAWVKGLMDLIIHRFFGYTDLEFLWTQEEDNDPLQQAQVDKIYIEAGVYTPAYVAERLGVDQSFIPDEPPAAAMANKQLAAKQPEPGQETDKPEPDAEKMEKADRKKKIQPIDRERAELQPYLKELADLLTAFFRKQGAIYAKKITQAMGKADDSAEVERVMGELDFYQWSQLIQPTTAILEKIAIAGVVAAKQQISLGSQDADRITDLASKDAIAYAKKRGAELVGMRILPDGEIVVNPNPHWAITETTRDNLRTLVTKATAEGWSNADLAKTIKASESFSPGRAMTVARTESAFADVQGSAALWKRSGVVKKKEWITANDDKVSPDCVLNGEAGAIDFDATFPSGQKWAPDHPNCRCAIVPVLN